MCPLPGIAQVPLHGLTHLLVVEGAGNWAHGLVERLSCLLHVLWRETSLALIKET